MAAIEIYPDAAALTRAAAEQVVRHATEAIAASGRFTLALSGGSTPRPVYELLASDAFAPRVHWPKVQVFWGDERCVPPDDPESNYRMAREALLDHVPLPPENIHRIHGEDDPPHAAAAYARELQSVFGGDAERGRTRGPTVGPATGFDLILLGMGDNAHTVSLFPGKAAVREQTRWVRAEYIEEVAMWRVTLTPVAINAAKNVTFLVAGARKAEPLREVLQGSFEPDRLPAQVVQPTHGQLTWLLDRAAASRLNGVP